MFATWLPNKVAPKRMNKHADDEEQKHAELHPFLTKQEEQTLFDGYVSPLDQYCMDFVSQFSSSNNTLKSKTDMLEDSVEVYCEILLNRPRLEGLAYAITECNLFDVVLHVAVSTTNNKSNGGLKLLQATLAYCLDEEEAFGNRSSAVELVCYKWVTKLLQVKALHVQRVPKANLLAIFIYSLRGLDPTHGVLEEAGELNAHLLVWINAALNANTLSARDNLSLSSMRLLRFAEEHKDDTNVHVAATCQSWISALMGDE